MVKSSAMKKALAIELLGGTVKAAARELEVTYQAVDKWPEELPRRIADRVLGAYARKAMPEVVDRWTRQGDEAAANQAELFAQGDREGAAGHDATLPAAASAVHHHAGVGR